jgi:LysM repeat protein
MIDISVLYAVDLDKLYIRNRMIHGQEPAENALVKIRGGKAKKQPALQSDQPNKKPTPLPTVPNQSSTTSTAKPTVPLTPAQNNTESRPAIQPIKVGTNTSTDLASNNKPKPTANSTDPFSKSNTTAAPSNNGNSNNTILAPQYYQLLEGDTLEIVAQKFKTSVEGIKKLNNLVNNECKPGVKIRVK